MSVPLVGGTGGCQPDKITSLSFTMSSALSGPGIVHSYFVIKFAHFFASIATTVKFIMPRVATHTMCENMFG